MDYKSYLERSVETQEGLNAAVEEAWNLVKEELSLLMLAYGTDSVTMIEWQGMATALTGLEQVKQGIQIFNHA